MCTPTGIYNPMLMVNILPLPNFSPFTSPYLLSAQRITAHKGINERIGH
jgi:hypothetical protein